MQRINGEVPAGLQRQLSIDRAIRQHHVVANGVHRTTSSSGSVSSDMDDYEPMASLHREPDDYIMMKSATRKSGPIEYEDMQPYPVGREKIEQYTILTSPTKRCVHVHTYICSYVCVKVHKFVCTHICVYVCEDMLCTYMCHPPHTPTSTTVP